MSVDFDDGKDEGALRTIGEVSKALGLKPHVLRYWEQQFPMLEPLKRSGGRRYYRPEDIAMIERIDQLVNAEGYTLKGAEAALKGGTDAGAASQVEKAQTAEAKPAAKAGSSGEVPADVIAQLKTIRANLTQALEA